MSDDLLIGSMPFTRAVMHYEGYYPKPYKCPAGVWTIGYGHTRGVNRNTKTLFAEEAIKLLEADLEEAASDVKRLTAGCLASDNNDKAASWRLEALASFVFNVGAGSLASSTLLKRLKAGRFEDAAQEFLRWNKATIDGTKCVLAGLTKRRKCESHYFLTGEIVLY